MSMEINIWVSAFFFNWLYVAIDKRSYQTIWRRERIWHSIWAMEYNRIKLTNFFESFTFVDIYDETFICGPEFFFKNIVTEKISTKAPNVVPFTQDRVSSEELRYNGNLMMNLGSFLKIGLLRSYENKLFVSGKHWEDTSYRFFQDWGLAKLSLTKIRVLIPNLWSLEPRLD